MYVYLWRCSEGQHGVYFKEVHKTSHELVVGDHLHQALAVGLILVSQHAGSGCGAGEIGLHICCQVWLRCITATQ